VFNINGILNLNFFEYPKERDKDINVKTVYAFTLDPQSSLGVSFNWDKIKNISKWYYENIPPTYGDYTKDTSDYNRFDLTLGFSRQITDRAKMGISGGGGGYTGDQGRTNSDLFSGLTDTGKGDFKGEQVHLLSNLEYKVNESLYIPVVLKGTWDNKEQNVDVSGNYLGAYDETYRESQWDILVKTGLNHINQDSGLLVAGEFYYLYSDWEGKTRNGYGSYDLDESQQTNTFGVKVSLEKELTKKLTGRMGVYYSYGFYDRSREYTRIPPTSSDYDISGDGWLQKLGLGTGFCYAPQDNLKFEFGADTVFINHNSYNLDGYRRDGNPSTRDRDEDDILYRFGCRLTYLF